MFESSAVSAYFSPFTYIKGKLVNQIHVICSHHPQGLPKGYEDVPFYFWFNTSFIEDNKCVSFSISADQRPFFLYSFDCIIMTYTLFKLSSGCFYPGKSWTTHTNQRPGTCTRKTLVSLCSSQNLNKRKMERWENLFQL